MPCGKKRLVGDGLPQMMSCHWSMFNARHYPHLKSDVSSLFVTRAIVELAIEQLRQSLTEH